MGQAYCQPLMIIQTLHVSFILKNLNMLTEHASCHVINATNFVVYAYQRRQR